MYFLSSFLLQVTVSFSKNFSVSPNFSLNEPNSNLSRPNLS